MNLKAGMGGLAHSRLHISGATPSKAGFKLEVSENYLIGASKSFVLLEGQPLPHHS